MFVLACLALFLLLIGLLIYRNYNTPGFISYLGLLFSLINSFALFFKLGSKFSIVGFVALAVGFFYGLFLITYFLDFLRKLCKIQFLDKNSISLAFKKGLFFSVDFSFPLFIFSSLVSFLAPPYLREFGILLSIFVFVMFFSFMAINYLVVNFVKNNFISVKEMYRETIFKKTFFIRFFESFSKQDNPVLTIGTLIALGLLGFIFFNFWGFNSFSLFKDNFLITFDLNEKNLSKTNGDTSLDTVKNALSLEKIKNVVNKDLIVLGSNSYLVKDAFNTGALEKLFKEHLAENAFSIQNTSAFNESEVFLDSLLVFLFSISLISIYIFIRFGFINLINLWINLFSTIFLFFSLLSLTRVWLNHDIFVVFLALFAFTLLINIFWFNSFNFKLEPDIIVDNNIVEKLQRKVLNIKSRESSVMLFSIFFLFISFLWSTKKDLIILNFYIFLSFSLSYFFSQFLFLFLWKKLYLLRFSILKNISKKTHFVKKLSIFGDNLELEEEKIDGINANFN